jgi:hypothetical protein
LIATVGQTKIGVVAQQCHADGAVTGSPSEFM